MIDLNQVLTFTEAAEKWGLAGGNTLRQAVLRGKFEPFEIKKSGTVWLTTYDAMTRVFGEPAAAVTRINQSQILQSLRDPDPQQLTKINSEVEAAFHNQKKIMITEKIFKKEQTLYIFSTLEEYQNWLTLIQQSINPHSN